MAPGAPGRSPTLRSFIRIVRKARREGTASRAVVNAGGIGINIEDGGSAPDLLASKIEAVRSAAAAAGVDLFSNARTDVYLRSLVSAERAVEETIARAARYREAGADGIFAAAVTDPDDIRTIAAEIGLPLNVLVVPGLPSVADLAGLGVARVSAGSGIAQVAAGVVHRLATEFFGGRTAPLLERSINYGDLNALFAARLPD